MKNYIFNTEVNLKEFDDFVISSDQNSLFQCSSWALVKENWDHIFTSVTLDGEIVATALVLVRKMPFHTTLFYIPRGPVMDYKNEELVHFYLDNLKKLAKKHHAIAVRFDPAILTRVYSYKDRNNDIPLENLDVVESLKKYGAIHSGFTTKIEESTQPRFNAEMNVTKDFEDHLEHKTMKCVRNAIHKGIEIKEGREEVKNLAVAMHYTEVRKQVALRSEDYFAHMMDVYGDYGICMSASLNFPKQLKRLEDSINEKKEQLALNPTKKQKAALVREIAQDEKEYQKLEEDYKREGKEEVITSGILACYNKNLMELFYMGNNPDYLRMYSSYLLYKLCLDRCVELGIEKCSFGGIEGTLDDGLTLFKSNWLMNVEEYIGEFNIILNHPVYYAFNTVYPKVLKLAAKARGKK